MLRSLGSNYDIADPATVDYRGSRYDYGSIMHYSSHWGRAFALEPIPDKTVRIGQRNGLSRADIAQANSMYKCRGKVSQEIIPCPVSSTGRDRRERVTNLCDMCVCVCVCVCCVCDESDRSLDVKLGCRHVSDGRQLLVKKLQCR